MPLLGRLYSVGRRVVNLALAPTFSDAQQILEEAAADLAGVYEPGDRIVIFGFSRGAALARKFATLLLDADERRSVDFLGVFDTVAAMGGLRGGEVDHGEPAGCMRGCAGRYTQWPSTRTGRRSLRR